MDLKKRRNQFDCFGKHFVTVCVKRWNLRALLQRCNLGETSLIPLPAVKVKQNNLFQLYFSEHRGDFFCITKGRSKKKQKTNSVLICTTCLTSLCSSSMPKHSKGFWRHRVLCYTAVVPAMTMRCVCVAPECQRPQTLTDTLVIGHTLRRAARSNFKPNVPIPRCRGDYRNLPVLYI